MINKITDSWAIRAVLAALGIITGLYYILDNTLPEGRELAITIGLLGIAAYILSSRLNKESNVNVFIVGFISYFIYSITLVILKLEPEFIINEELPIGASFGFLTLAAYLILKNLNLGGK